MLVPSIDAEDRLSPTLDGPATLEGAVGGEGREGGTGEPGKRPVAPAPMGEGSTGARDDVGELCTGREGSEGPPVSGECCLMEVEGECTEGEPDDIVPDLKGFTGLSVGLRIGTAPGES